MRKSLPKLLCAAALCAGSSAQAQLTARDMGLTTDELIEGGRLFLSAEVDALYTDNFYYTAGDSEDAYGLLLKPAVAWLFGMPRFSFGASTSAEAGLFDTPGTQDNYIDATARLRADWKPAERHQLRYTYAFLSDHDPFGMERTEGTAATPGTVDRELDKWNDHRFDAGYHFGTGGTPIALDAKVVTEKKVYTSNRDDTVFLDYHSVGGQVTLFYNYSPKTSLLADVIGTRTRPEEVATGATDRSSDELRYRLGLRWLATGKTTGDIRVGYLDRRHPDPNVADVTGLDWQVAVGWAPVASDLLTFQTGRSTRESYFLNTDFLDTNYYTVEWAREWSQLLTTKVSTGYVTTDFVGSPNNRQDNSWSGAFHGEYRFARSMAFLGNISYNQRESSRGGLDYDRFASYVGVRYVR